MRRNAMTVAFAMLFALAACGSADKGGNKVEMKDMEVVDGTATDAMTDLDGVQSEGAAVALPTRCRIAMQPTMRRPLVPSQPSKRRRPKMRRFWPISDGSALI